MPRNFSFTSDRRDTFGGWSRCVKVDNQEYSLSVQRGKSVRIAYAKRGQNRGWKWRGSVYRIGNNPGHVWSGEVRKSTGCRGLLLVAGILPFNADKITWSAIGPEPKNVVND